MDDAALESVRNEDDGTGQVQLHVCGCTLPSRTLCILVKYQCVPTCFVGVCIELLLVEGRESAVGCVGACD